MSTTPTITPLPPRRPSTATEPPAHHVGNPPTSFKNPWPSYSTVSLGNTLKARFSSSRNFVPVPSDRSQLVPVQKPDFGIGREGVQGGLKATWIGHASFLVETPTAKGAERGVRILLDPVWSSRVGPYGVVGPVRFIEPPCTVEELPEVDAVCISHDHYDHLDSDTIKRVRARGKGKVRLFCGLGNKSTLVGLGVGVKAEEVTELDWWDGVELNVEGVGSARLVCTPAQHRSGRTPWGFDSTLWCSWVLEEVVEGELPSAGSSTVSSKDEKTSSSVGKKLYFAGDTGYCTVPADTEPSPAPPCPAFAEIGSLYGPFDLALLPIGCYLPRNFMSSQHSSPDDSLRIHKDIKSKKSIGMHYGTLRGGISGHYEPVTEPPLRWKKACEEEGLKWGEEVGVCAIGETVVV